MSDRVEFEKYVLEDGEERYMLDKDPDGSYKWAETNRDWNVWQAARAQGGEAVQPFAYHCIRGGRQCFSRTLAEGDAALWAMSGASITPLYTQSRASVPEVCDGKEQKAFEVYASRKGYDMTEHPLHYLFIHDKTNTARQAWKAAISYCHEVAAPPQPADGWIKCSELSLAHIDERGDVWGLDDLGNISLEKAESLMEGWHNHIIAFQPTGLKRPNPPEQGADDHE